MGAFIEEVINDEDSSLSKHQSSHHRTTNRENKGTANTFSICSPKYEDDTGSSGSETTDCPPSYFQA